MTRKPKPPATPPSLLRRIAAIDKKLVAVIDKKLDQIIYALVARGKQPVAFTIRWRKNYPRRQPCPETMFLRAVTLGVPFEVNGTLYRPVKARRRK